MLLYFIFCFLLSIIVITSFFVCWCVCLLSRNILLNTCVCVCRRQIMMQCYNLNAVKHCVKLCSISNTHLSLSPSLLSFRPFSSSFSSTKLNSWLVGWKRVEKKFEFNILTAYRKGFAKEKRESNAIEWTATIGGLKVLNHFFHVSF